MVKKTKIRVMVTLPKDLYEKSKCYCDKYDKSFSQFIIDLLHDKLDK